VSLAYNVSVLQPITCLYGPTVPSQTVKSVWNHWCITYLHFKLHSCNLMGLEDRDRADVDAEHTFAVLKNMLKSSHELPISIATKRCSARKLTSIAYTSCASNLRTMPSNYTECVNSTNPTQTACRSHVNEQYTSSSVKSERPPRYRPCFQVFTFLLSVIHPGYADAAFYMA
jgi:hypothetical protein